MTNQPLHDPETRQLYGRQAEFEQLLESAFPPVFPSDPDPEKTIHWLASNIDKGLWRVYAVNLNECWDKKGCKRLLEFVSRRINDPQLIELLKEILAASSDSVHPSLGPLAPLLADIAFESIDQILQQAKALGREENFLHVQCTRMGNQLVVLSDRDPRYDWIMPAVQKRLREELSILHYEPAAIETQCLDMTCGEPLRFLDFEVRCVQGKHGESQVQYRLVEEARRLQAETAPARWRLLGRFHSLRFMQRYSNGMKHLLCWQLIHDAFRKLNTIQVGWRHLPIALCPVFLLLFGCRSPAPWLCFLSIFVCNWRWTLDRGGRFGRWAWRHKLDMVITGCVVAALIFLSPLLRDIYANRPREVAVSSSLPPGFYRGEYHGDSWWNGEPAPAIYYGLYVPPHFQGQKGPFPLIVFLHGFGERYVSLIFKAGLSAAIAHHFGANKPNGSFPFVAFFPLDPMGRWQAGSAEVENVMMALDYVIERHRIDPARVYLTGYSVGGIGVWNLAQAYPDRWAAVAPVSGFISPDVEKVRHIPAWIFHGEKDNQAPVEPERILVRQLQASGADMRYTEVPNKGHFIGDIAYNNTALYEWLASKKID